MDKKQREDYLKYFKKKKIKSAIITGGLAAIAIGAGIEAGFHLGDYNYEDGIYLVRELVSPFLIWIGSSFSVAQHGMFKIYQDQYNLVKKGEQPINYIFF